jgi:hypothetical protein
MLSERQSKLLSEYLDGELSARRRRAAARLLRRSAEARSLLRQLKVNAQRLSDLPQPQLPPEFALELLRKIGTLPPVAASAASARLVPAWLGGAVAAAVLLLVSTGSYFFFANILPHEQTPAVPIAKEIPKQLDPLAAKIFQGTVERFGEPGIVVAVQDLVEEKTQKRLARELKKENALHLELACKNSAQAVDGLSHAFADNGIKLLVDPGAKAKLKAVKPAPTEFLVYAENLSHEELANILKQLGIQEKHKSSQDRQFDSVRLETMTNEERQQLSMILGVDAKDLQPAPLADLPTFIEAPKANKAKSGKSDDKERFAMVVASNGPASSAEVRQFLRSRSELRPGTLQVVLVVRPATA